MSGSLWSVHGDAAADELSSDALSYELQGAYAGMMVATPPDEWACFRTMSLSAFAKQLQSLAQRVDVNRYRRSRPSPKKPLPSRGQYHNGGYAPTA